jgi:hypothetical protein
MNKKLATAVVIINWILFALVALAYITFVAICITAFDTAADLLSDLVQKNSETGATEQETQEAARTVLTIFVAIAGVILFIAIGIQLALNILLTRAVNQANRRKCNIWLVINLVFFVLGIIALIRELYELIAGEGTYSSLILDLISLLWLGVSLFLIKRYRDELGTNASYAGVVYSKTDNPA